MGRHARGAARSRVPVVTVVLGVLVVGVIAIGSWFGLRADSMTRSDSVDATAVVISSLACPGGSGRTEAGPAGPGIGRSGQTLVDVLPPVDFASGSLVRATLDGCGFQEGQRLAVQYRTGAPTAVTLADGAPASEEGGAMLPVGLAVAGLLAVLAALAVYLDGRGRPLRHRHAAGSESDEHLPEEVGLAGEATGGPQRTHSADREDAWCGHLPAVASDGRPMVTAGPGLAGQWGVDAPAVTTSPWNILGADPLSLQYPDRNGHGPFTAAQARAASAAGGGALPGERGRGAEVTGESVGLSDASKETAARPEMSSLDLIFPFSSTLAASLHDELFTHRSTSS